MEVRDVAVANKPGALLHTDMLHGDHIVHARLCGVLADLLVKIDPAEFLYKVVLEGGQKVIYADLGKALYDALITILLLWRYLSGDLGYWVSEPN